MTNSKLDAARAYTMRALEQALRNPVKTSQISVETGQFPSIDITGVEAGVEILHDQQRGVLWVNVDGICRLRICRLPSQPIQVKTLYE